VQGPDPRVERVAAQLEAQDQSAPRMARLVPTAATGPEECHDLMALDFRSHYFQAFGHIPSYSSWLLDADLTSTYMYERRVLKLLQWGQPTRPWRLKCPSHLLWLDHLDHAFPDARFVMTHRDPVEVLVSVADLYAEMQAQFNTEVDRDYLGRLNVEHWSMGMQRALIFRENTTGDRFFDMDFRAMQRDPIGQVRRLYAWLGEPISDDFEANMGRWWKGNAANRQQNIHPDPSQFGLDPEQVRPLFANYTAHLTSWFDAETGADR